MVDKTDVQSLFLFATPVLTKILDDYENLNRRLEELIYEQERASSGMIKSNIGGWHSKDDMMAWAPQEARTLLQTAIASVAPYTADIHPAGKRDFEFDANMWANINRKGHANNTHAHPGCLWSCAYYVNDGSDGNQDVKGEFVIEDPRFPMNVMYVPNLVTRDTDGEPQKSIYTIKPQTGMMVMFPSWLRHSVRPYKGNKDRISVAFNLMVNQVE